MVALDWLGYLIEWIGKLFPRVALIRATQGGVKFKWGRKVVEVKPGITIYWPIVTELVTVPTVRQSFNVVTQSLQTKDGVPVAAGVVLIYYVADVLISLSKTHNVEEVVSDVAQTSLYEFVSKRTLDEIQRDEHGLTRIAQRKLRKYGIRVKQVGFTDFTQCRAINLIGNK